MADLEFLDLDPVASLAPDDQVLIHRGGVPRRFTGKLAALTANGGLPLAGSYLGGGWARPDAAVGIRAPLTGTPGQRHALMLFEQPWVDDEWAIVGFMPIGGVLTQTHTFFNALQAGNASPASFRPYQAIHGVSARGDYTPWIAYNDNAMEFLSFTGSKAFDLGLTAPDWMRNFCYTLLQGGAKIGNTNQAFTTGSLLEVVGPPGANGFIFAGTQNAIGGPGSKGVSVGWHASSSQVLLQSYDFVGGAFQPMTVNAAEFRIGQGPLVPDTNNARDLGKSGQAWRNVFSVNAVTVTSDGRLKKVRGDGRPTREEIAWAKSIRFVPYQMLDSIAEKGEDGARIHWGVIAQDVAAAGIAAGVANPYRHGFLTLDPIYREEVCTEEVEERDTVDEPFTHRRIEMQDGRAVSVEVTEVRQVPRMASLPLFDEAGEPMMREVPDPRGPFKTIDPATGQRKQRPPVREQITVEVPVMRKVPVERTRQVPVLLDDGTPDMRHGVRYEALFAFLAACGVSPGQ